MAKLTPEDVELIEFCRAKTGCLNCPKIYDCMNLENTRGLQIWKCEYKICPICGAAYMDRPAISRIDNETEICPDCGTRQALADWPHT